MTNTHLQRSIRSLHYKLRKVPVLQRTAAHQTAANHVRLALHLSDKNEAAALEHFEAAVAAAQPYMP